MTTCPAASPTAIAAQRRNEAAAGTPRRGQAYCTTTRSSLGRLMTLVGGDDPGDERIAYHVLGAKAREADAGNPAQHGQSMAKAGARARRQVRLGNVARHDG